MKRGREDSIPPNETNVNGGIHNESGGNASTDSSFRRLANPLPSSSQPHSPLPSNHPTSLPPISHEPLESFPSQRMHSHFASPSLFPPMGGHLPSVVGPGHHIPSMVNHPPRHMAPLSPMDSHSQSLHNTHPMNVHTSPTPRVSPVVNSFSSPPPMIPSISSLSQSVPIQRNVNQQQIHPHNPPMNQPAPPAVQPGRREKFDNALDFLDQVKLQFSDQPKVYNQFLDIMKDFKAQCIDTPGVIARVSELFKGHKNLIFGFNSFLPPGYKIEAVPDDEPVVITVPGGSNSSMSQSGAASSSLNDSKGMGANAAGGMQRKAPEFDHARDYVKKIKQRFVTQPHVYKAFLKILHTYHQEQHTIKDVYEHVALLFAKHQDLLEEFTQFLPDPMAAQPLTNQGQMRGAKKPPRKPKEKEKMDKFERQEREKDAKDRDYRDPKESRESRAEKRENKQQENISKKPVRKKETRGEERNQHHAEIQLFNKIKQRLNNQQLYTEFLKCLSLYSQEVISRVELALLVKDLLSKHRDLFDWFRHFIGIDASILEAFERSADENQFESQREQIDIDFKTCKRCGPSYRALPKHAIIPVCSGRTPLCESVLNNVWVSVTTGTEEGVFKQTRKNQFEEMLFKCEDDRFELDLVIECNLETIRALEEILNDYSKCNEEEAKKFRVKEPLEITSVRTIERIYGERAQEVIDAFYESPTEIIPIILIRLRQKDEEWAKARREWNKLWRDVSEKNYYKAIDSQSFNFKQTDKRNLMGKALIQEIKLRYQQKGKSKKSTESEPVIDESSMEIDEKPNGKEEEMEDRVDDQKSKQESSTEPNHSIKSPHLQYNLVDPSIFENVIELVSFAAEKNLSKLDREKIEIFLKKFIREFFMVEKLPTPPKQKYNVSKLVLEREKVSVDSDGNVVYKESPEESAMEIAQPSHVEKTTDNQEKKSNIFFGHSPFYVMFRLLQVVYERLSKAKDLAYSTAAGIGYAYLLNTARGRIESGEEKYKSYLKNLFALVSNMRESNTYEDECRSLLGMDAYVLFTMNSVVSQLIKQLQVILAEGSEESIKLLALYSLQGSKTSFRETVYHSSCVDVLGDEKCFRFEYEFAPTLGSFQIQLLDSAKNPPQYISFDLKNGSSKNTKWLETINKIINPDIKVDPSKQKFIFMKRNTKGLRGKKAPELIHTQNLECKISIPKCKMYFVEETEDYLFRRGALARSREIATQKSKISKENKKERVERIVENKKSKSLFKPSVEVSTPAIEIPVDIPGDVFNFAKNAIDTIDKLTEGSMDIPSAETNS
eukprot:TRINITY_DN5733_c0_g1_i1.p1 TRINITY_DN5733_c0_g1~~TRINITY_DN5733_c0_g1_i1.p1  ORF type:complete len:1288 (-),score=467.49 TRINITY_DN5733_c0_g1_i1:104-3967(-)